LAANPAAFVQNGIIEVGPAIQPDGTFSYQVPARLVLTVDPATNLQAPSTATVAGGGVLPAWLIYDPDSRTFTAKSPPTGGLPFKAQLQMVKANGGGVTIPVNIGAP
jgi:hypothetical protein